VIPFPPGPALLFCPADRPDRYTKAAAAADAVILDLEDGVAPDDKRRARRALRENLLDPRRTIVRINAAGTDDAARDVDALATTPYAVLMLPKAEAAAQAEALAPRQVIALCETPRGVLAAPELAAVPTVVALMWGAEDLVAAIGGRSSRHADGRYRDVARHARSATLLAAAASLTPAVDAVYLDIDDADGLRTEAEDGAASGFVAKACIHPRQVAVVRAAFQPSPAEIAWAQRVLAAAERASGVFAFEGRMVDAPVLRHAQHVARAARAQPTRG
jgi:citrate lyase subunit beta / citryl-CoA lyase